MRTLAGVLVLIFTIALPYKQAPDERDCKLQELAIDAALGDALARHNLGVAFHRGEGVPRDYAKAAIMWRQSSSAGVLESYNNLGHLTYYGRGVKQDYAEGLRLWRIAARKGYAESQVHMGFAYSDGKHLKKDIVEAYAWAKAGRFYADRMEDAELGKKIKEMANKLLNDLQSQLTERQLIEADGKGVEYIKKFGPK